jgi:hypothetical protein
VRLVEAAPLFEQWTVIAFRQPKNVDFSIRMDDYELSPDDIWFTYKPSGDKFDIMLYIRDLTKKNMELAQHASFILLDNALGEYVTETKVGVIEHRALPANPKPLQLLPFSSINSVIR